MMRYIKGGLLGVMAALILAGIIVGLATAAAAVIIVNVWVGESDPRLLWLSIPATIIISGFVIGVICEAAS